jgi:anti-sigma factor RsiW
MTESSVLISDPPSAGHIPEEHLEAYALGKLADQDAVELNAHVLDCDECCLRLVEEAQFIEALRYALVELGAGSSSSRNPMASKKALRTSAGCPS